MLLLFYPPPPPKKNELTYRRVYDKISELLSNVIIDIEKASFNAINAVFPNLSINGYFFHFSQSVCRTVVNLGVKQDYHNNNKFVFLKMRHFSDLAFVPSRDVPEVFEELTGDDMMPQEFFILFRIYIQQH